jgi:hypothetical protein
MRWFDWFIGAIVVMVLPAALGILVGYALVGMSSL